MKYGVIGCGRWGTFIAWYLNRIGHDTTIYGRAQSKRMQDLSRTRSNGVVTLDSAVTTTFLLSDIFACDVIIISVGAQGLRSLMEELEVYQPQEKTFVLCMKGLEMGSGKRLSQVVKETIDPRNHIAVWLGPGHVQEFCNGIPNCMVIDSEEEQVKERLIEALSSDLIRFYYGTDLIGNEIGAASKNVIGIAAGMLDGLSLSSLKGALMSRGTREIARLIKALGGDERSAYGLCHLGDYEATVFSKYSHNRKYGELLVRGETFHDLAEGHFTVKALQLLAERCYCATPICTAVYDVIYEGRDPRKTLDRLFSRSLKNEF